MKFLLRHQGNEKQYKPFPSGNNSPGLTSFKPVVIAVPICGIFSFLNKGNLYILNSPKLLTKVGFLS